MTEYRQQADIRRTLSATVDGQNNCLLGALPSGIIESMKNKQLKQVLKLAESMGHAIDNVVAGKHFKVYLTTLKGEKKILTVSVTASDGRAVKSNIAILKGWRI